MQQPSPPKHRHDGTSPLPLGMDWSPPPRQWNGPDTVWPHDSRTGWSYCVTIPSWVVLPKSRDSDPVVFYKVHVGVQSPEGVTTTRGVLRRFNDFLKLFTDLKNMFPKKSIPSTPAKGLLRLKSRTLLEERRRSLEEWMVKLLSDINISRSILVASFLELEAAARSSFQDMNPQASEADSQGSLTQSNLPTIVGSSSMASDYGSDTAYEISEAGRDDNSEIGLDDLKLDDPIEKLVKCGMSNIDEGLLMGQTILDQLEGLPRNKGHSRHFNSINGNGSKASLMAANGLDLFSDAEISKVIAHARKLSDESEGSDVSSLRGSELSNQGIPNSSGDGSEQHTSGFPQLLLPLDQRNKMNRLLQTMQRRLVTAKTDMEDLIARFNQETAVKDYLATKVKDLEVELETDRQKSIENLHQALLVERERCTKVQWDMEELRQKSLEMELKLKSKSEKEEKTSTESTSKSQPVDDQVEVLKQLDSSKQQLEILTKQYEELEAKSKADRKVLVKEVKHLRSSCAKLENELSKSLQEKPETEMLLKQEREKSDQVETAKKTLLQKCKILHERIHECNLGLSSSSPEEALNLLTTSDDQISLLLKEAEMINQEIGASAFDPNECHETIIKKATDDELGKTIANIITDEVRLRKRVNSVLHRRKQTDIVETSSPVKDKSS